jgi:hypothetical protein
MKLSGEPPVGIMHERCAEIIDWLQITYKNIQPYTTGCAVYISGMLAMQKAHAFLGASSRI